MKVTIVMYHYVRKIRGSAYPRIKGLETSEFEEQIIYLKKYYNFINPVDLISAIRSDAHDELPPRLAMLTFDDGYIDHYDNVFPILMREKIYGAFFPPARCIESADILDVNKIHFILACAPDISYVVKDLRDIFEENSRDPEIDTFENYYKRLAKDGRFDRPEVVFVKRLLQRELPEDIRGRIVDFLFRKYVTDDARGFARELYMSTDHLRAMREAGMYIGSHGYSHRWLNRLGPADQEFEIRKSLEFLEKLGCNTDGWIMCYPYGAYNDSLLGVVARAGGIAGLTTEVGIADLSRHNPLTLPRLDTNDLPKVGDAAPNVWTQRVGVGQAE